MTSFGGGVRWGISDKSVCAYVNVCVCVCVWRQRQREREREGERKEKDRTVKK